MTTLNGSQEILKILNLYLVKLNLFIANIETLLSTLEIQTFTQCMRLYIEFPALVPHKSFLSTLDTSFNVLVHCSKKIAIGGGFTLLE